MFIRLDCLTTKVVRTPTDSCKEKALFRRNLSKVTLFTSGALLGVEGWSHQRWSVACVIALTLAAQGHPDLCLLNRWCSYASQHRPAPALHLNIPPNCLLKYVPSGKYRCFTRLGAPPSTYRGYSKPGRTGIRAWTDEWPNVPHVSSPMPVHGIGFDPMGVRLCPSSRVLSRK